MRCYFSNLRRKNVLSNRPKTATAWTGSRRRLRHWYYSAVLFMVIWFFIYVLPLCLVNKVEYIGRRQKNAYKIPWLLSVPKNPLDPPKIWVQFFVCFQISTETKLFASSRLRCSNFTLVPIGNIRHVSLCLVW